MDIRSLRVFRTVANCGGLSVSEFELNIGRSSSRRHLFGLESHIGMKLCNRDLGGFSISREVGRVLGTASQVIDAIYTIQSWIDDLHRNLRSTLYFVLFNLAVGNPEASVRDAIARFLSSAPDQQIRLSTDTRKLIEAGNISDQILLVTIEENARKLDVRRVNY